MRYKDWKINVYHNAEFRKAYIRLLPAYRREMRRLKKEVTRHIHQERLASHEHP